MLKTAGFAALFAIAIAAPAGAQLAAPPAASGVRVQTELLATTPTSTRKTKRTTKAVAVQVAPPRPVWTGPDPTKGPGIERLHQLQREGRCVIDEGYGRFTYCSDR